MHYGQLREKYQKATILSVGPKVFYQRQCAQRLGSRVPLSTMHLP
jgi:hypothetical protein